MIKIAPSILAADFRILEKQISEAEKGGADWIHIDVMDGHFVPNITFGPLIVEAVRKCTKLPLDVHLMIEEPERYIKIFRSVGADIITIHQEASNHLYKHIQDIKECGSKAGISINPATPVHTLTEIIEQIDLVLIMTVEPGFGGQKFIPSTIKKIEHTHDLIKSTGKDIYLEVDGGIDKVTAPSVVRAGANVLVAGTSVFQSDSISSAIEILKKSDKS